MLNKYLRASIIVLTKYILPAVLFLLLIPQLVQLNPQLTQANEFFHFHQTGFMLGHGVFYLALYCFWSRIISFLVQKSHNHITEEQLHFALNAKWYLLATLFFFEILFWLRQS